jgi:hypothetical protein
MTANWRRQIRLVGIAIVPTTAAQVLSIPALSAGLGLGGLAAFLSLTALAPWLGLCAFGYDQRARSCRSSSAARDLARFAIPVGLTLALMSGLLAPWLMPLLYPGWSHRTAAALYVLTASLAGVLACGREASYAIGQVEAPIVAHALASLAALLGVWITTMLGLPMACYVIAWAVPYAVAGLWYCRISGFIPARPLPTATDLIGDARRSWPYAAQTAGFVGLLSFDLVAFVPGRGTVGAAYALYSKFVVLGGTIGMTVLAQYISRAGVEHESAVPRLATRLLVTWAGIAATVSCGALAFGDWLLSLLAGLPPHLFGPAEAIGLFLVISARGISETWAMIAAIRRHSTTARVMSLSSLLGVLMLFAVGRTQTPSLSTMFLCVALAWLVPGIAGYLGHRKATWTTTTPAP